MNYKPIIIMAGEPNSIFLELYFKVINREKFKSPHILIASKKLLKLQMIKLKFKKKIRLIDHNQLKKYKLNNKSINLINIDYETSKAFEKISSKSNEYLERCFQMALKLLKKNISKKFINGPISKKYFLKKKYLGVTEYLAKKTKRKKFAMLIYNKDLSVCPITTHLPLKSVAKKITKKIIKEKIILIDSFFKKTMGFKPNIAVTGLNPHCESVHKVNEDIKIIKPVINSLKKLNYKINGPYSADTIFLKKNRQKYNVITGMYHDQVLTPLKTLYEYDAINITLGLPFIRVSPDHGPNEKMLGKNSSNPLSLLKSIKFLDTIK